MELENKVALVTGAGQGMGAAIAMKLAIEGAKVVVNDLNLEAAQNVVSKIKAINGEAMACAANVADYKAVQTMVDEVVKYFGTIDILVNNAGIQSRYLLEDLPIEDWDRTIAVTLSGAFYCCKAVMPIMIKKRYGKILNIGSVAVLD